jgi:hypothetical protein
MDELNDSAQSKNEDFIVHIGVAMGTSKQGAMPPTAPSPTSSGNPTVSWIDTMFGASVSNNIAAHPAPVTPAAAATPAAPAPSTGAVDTSEAAATRAAIRDTVVLRSSSKEKFSDVEVKDLPHMALSS